MTTNNIGQVRNEYIMVLIGKPNLQPGQQVLVSYGKKYLLLFRKALEHVKQEPPD